MEIDIEPGTFRCKRGHGSVVLTQEQIDNPEEFYRARQAAAEIQNTCNTITVGGMCTCNIVDLLRSTRENPLRSFHI